MTVAATVLVGIGRHPVSGRACRASTDARAIELAMRRFGSSLEVVHAGDPNERALRDYLGMGIAKLTVLRIVAHADPLPALVQHLSHRTSPLILCGMCGEGGEDSGMLPYLFANRLGVPLVAGVVDVAMSDDACISTIARPRGQRSVVTTNLPVVATVHPTAPFPRAVAFGKARRGVIGVLDGSSGTDDRLQPVAEEPARHRPRRLRLTANGNATARLSSVLGSARAGNIVSGLSPQQAARLILDHLAREGVVAGQSGVARNAVDGCSGQKE